ncbi:hypothetical protein [Thermoanaerobacter uzonensis]|uniref:hypothetical protein n=1 Tax=Thermoanaerobacter uzonensis TaxID=447593 RepID=UPI000A8EBBD2
MCPAWAKLKLPESHALNVTSIEEEGYHFYQERSKWNAQAEKYSWIFESPLRS